MFFVCQITAKRLKKREVVFFFIISFQTGNEIVYYTVVLKQYLILSQAIGLNLQISGIVLYYICLFALTRKTVNRESNRFESKIHRRLTSHCGACLFLLQVNLYLLQSSGLIECHQQHANCATVPYYLYVLQHCFLQTKTEQSRSHLPYICTASNSMNRTETL